MKKLFYALIAVVLIALPVSATLGVPFAATAVGIGLVSAITPSNDSVVLAGLNKEIWLPDLMEGFYADDMFISECRDMSPFVSNNTINLAEAGVNPDVMINNSSYPISVSQRTDRALALPLDTYDTENTRIRKAETAELSYDKRKSIIYGHKQAIRMKFLEYAAHRIAPDTDGTYTPLIATTGADNGGGNKAMKWANVRALQKRFDNAEIPTDGRIIVLSQQHLTDLETEDLDRYNKVMDKGTICSFKIYKLADARLPRYKNTDGSKVAWEAAVANTDVNASIAFHKDEVMRAQGELDMFSDEKSAEQRADLIGFQMRGLSMPIRDKGIAAIYSPVA